MAGLTLQSAIVAAIVLILIVLLTVGFAARPVMAVPLLLLDEFTNPTNSPLGVMVGRLHVYPGDILTLALVVASIIRFLRWRNGPRAPKRLIVLLVILLLGLARGVASFGVQTPVVFGREMLSMVAAAIFFSTVRVTPELIRTLRNWLLVASTVLLIVAARFWVLHGFGTFASTGQRPLNTFQALIVLETTIFVVLFPPFRSAFLHFITPLVGIVVLLFSIERTVWAAGVVAIVVLVIAGKEVRGSGSLMTRRILAVTGVLAVVLLVAAGPTEVTSSLTSGIQQKSVTQVSTFSWRLQGWSILITRQLDGPTVDLVLGSPTGTGYDRVVEGVATTAYPHSEYVSTLDLTGLVGVILLLWLYLAAIKRCRKRLRALSPFVNQSALLFIVLMAVQLTFFIGYSEGILVGLMVGLAWGFVHGSSEVPLVDPGQHFTSASAKRLLLVADPHTPSTISESTEDGVP